MGLRSMQWDDWIELDNEFLKFHSIKASRIAERGVKCCKTAPEAQNAAIELLEELCTYLPERYPSLFQGLEGGSGGVKNLATGETIDIKERLEVDMEDPMQVCARLVQDDLAIMIEVRRRSNKTLAKLTKHSDRTVNTISWQAQFYLRASGVSKTNLE